MLPLANNSAARWREKAELKLYVDLSLSTPDAVTVRALSQIDVPLASSAQYPANVESRTIVQTR
jgi:hypothetical protein